MHFLGAVIAEKQDDIYGILAEWSEYADVDEYVKETRSEIIANGRADDQAYLEDHGNDTDPMHEKFKKAAAGRLALDDEAALKAYAEYRRLNLNEDGDAHVQRGQFLRLLRNRRMGGSRRLAGNHMP